MRRFLSLIAKAAISAVLMYFAFRGVDLWRLGERLAHINLGWFACEFLILVAQIYILAMRWRLIVQRCGGAIPLGDAFRFCMIGTFFNQTLPSTVGGDAARIWLLARSGAGWAIATYSVIVDRLLGVLGLALLVIAALPWSYDLVRDPAGRTALLLIGAGSLIACLVVIAIGWGRFAFMQRWNITRHLSAAASAAADLFRSWRSGGPALLLSLLIHMLTVAAAWSAAKSVGAQLSFVQSLILVPPVLLMAVVPISIAGWGVRESAMVAAFAYAGLPESDGLLVSVIYGVGGFAVGLLGGATWIFGPDEVKFSRLEDEKRAFTP